VKIKGDETMPELLIPVQHDLANRFGNGEALVRPGRIAPASWFLPTILGPVLRGLIIVTIVVAGMALLLTILVPALFIAVVLLLLGFSPFLLVAVGMVVTEDMESARGTRTAKTDCLCGERR
jgi:hypothetical protein